MIEDPAALIDNYVEHRAQREEQVLAALDAGRDRRGDHREDLSGAAGALVPMARESVLAHLQKLETRAARRDDDRWMLINGCPERRLRVADAGQGYT